MGHIRVDFVYNKDISQIDGIGSSSKKKKTYTQVIKIMDVKQIFLLAIDALKERKARSTLTILMVVVGSGLMIALNGINAGQNVFEI